MLNMTQTWKRLDCRAWMIAGLIAAMPVHAADNRIFAAGSLRNAVNDMVSAYEKSGGPRYVASYGPSGKLRQEIEQGNVADIFASASIEHTEALFKAGKLRSNLVLTRNQLCLMAAPGIALVSERLVDIILDPAIKVGTSTPKADPSGDYAWELFRNIDKLRPGAYAKLDAKALKLVGGEFNPAVTESAYPAIFREKKADVFVTYCTGAVDTAAQIPGLTWARFPDQINVAAVYGIGVAKDSSKDADAFVAFATGPEGRRIFERYGFK